MIRFEDEVAQAIHELKRFDRSQFSVAEKAFDPNSGLALEVDLPVTVQPAIDVLERLTMFYATDEMSMEVYYRHSRSAPMEIRQRLVRALADALLRDAAVDIEVGTPDRTTGRVPVRVQLRAMKVKAP